RMACRGVHSSVAFVAIALLAVGVAGADAATLPCQSAADPCVLGSTATIPVGVYDIRPRSLDIKQKTITISGGGEFRIEAANVLFEPGARMVSTGSDGNLQVVINATGTITLQSQGTSKSRIDVSGNFGGGSITLNANGNIAIGGP